LTHSSPGLYVVGVNNFRVSVAFVPGLEGWVCLGLVTAAKRVVCCLSEIEVRLLGPQPVTLLADL
jgi:hypothetical protein